MSTRLHSRSAASGRYGRTPDITSADLPLARCAGRMGEPWRACLVGRDDKPEGEVPGHNAAKEKLVGVAGASWGATVAQRALPGIQLGARPARSATFSLIPCCSISGLRCHAREGPPTLQAARTHAGSGFVSRAAGA